MTISRFRAATAVLLGSALVMGGCTAGQSVTPSSSSSSPSSAPGTSSSGGSSSSTGTTAGSGSAPATSGGAGSSPAVSASGTSSSTTSSSTISAAPSDTSLAIGFILEPESLDFTQVAGAAIPQVLLTNIYETLVKLDQSGKIVPSLAASWTVSPDNKTYTFTLRQGVKFSSGAAFTAADAKFSLDRVATAWKPEAYKAQMAVVASTAVVSPTVLKVTLKTPSNSWLFNMTGRVGAIFSQTGVADLANKPDRDRSLHVPDLEPR